MDHPLTSLEVSPSTVLPTGVAIPWRRLLPLWRHAFWLGAVFVVLATAVMIRVDVQRLYMDLDRNDRHQREAQLLNERLRLELQTRSRARAMEVAGLRLGLVARPEIVVVEDAP